ncbi:hypothetical protein F4604DRAFT_1926629 [Suillus subluteus]|nr:hypothetical protein F4604DRAFT_1926629 [Suillus subluteus]
MTRQRHLDADQWEQEHLHMRDLETDQQRGSPIPAPDPAVDDYVQEPQHDVELGYWMEVDDQYNGNDDGNNCDGREGDMYISLDDEENGYRTFLSQEDAVEEEDDLDEGADIVNDPAFNAGNGFDEDEDCLPQDNKEDLLFDEAPAFSEHSAIRNVYVCVYIASVFKGASHDVSRIILDGVTRALWYACDHTRDIKYEGLDDMAKTLPTAERHLGVNLDSIITYLFILGNSAMKKIVKVYST